MAINRCLYLNAQHELSIVEKEIPQPKQGEVLVKIAANGICGSDVHFFKDGRLGNFVVTDPYIPGHEASGTVAAVGSGVKRFKEGDRVAIEPGITCGICEFCKIGRYNLCPDMVFLSAPPVNGTFCDYVAIREDLVFPIPDSLSMEYASLVEPAAVAIQAVSRARIKPGASGVIVGVGPIGLLTLQAFKAAGGGHAICIDLLEKRLEIAKQLGADETYVETFVDTDWQNIGSVVFETAGSSKASAKLFHMAERGGTVVQVGWPDGNIVKHDVAVLIDKEIDYRGSHRYTNVYDTAITWLADGRINGDKIITHRFPFERAVEAFQWAADNPQETIKVVVEN